MKKTNNNIPKIIDPIEAFELLMENQLRMQILFYLLIFGELSLSELTYMMGKTKSTINHHTMYLEDDKIQILISRQQITKNYKEKYYQINPIILDFIKSQEKIEENIKEGKLDKNHLVYFFQSFSGFMYSIIERFINFVKKTPGSLPPETFKASIRINVVDDKQYKEKTKAIQEIFKDLPNESIYSKPSKNSYILFNIGLPYGKLFKPILKEKEKSKNTDI